MRDHTMADDLEIIKALEKEIGASLKEGNVKDWKNKLVYKTDEAQRVIALRIEDVKLSRFPRSLLQLKNLNRLDLWYNELHELPPGITGLQRLSYLDLRGNKFTQIPQPIFEMENLTHLIFGANKLKTISGKIEKLKNLETLWLHGNQITSLPEVTQLNKLSALGIGNNPLSNLPQIVSFLKAMASLRELDLGSLGLKSIPGELFDLRNLKILDLNRNEITTLPGGIEQLEKLEKLYLYINNISLLPPGIGKLKNLKLLILFNNNLTTLPASIGELENLVELVLAKNQLTHLPREIIQLKNLKTLDIEYNPLKQPPPEIVEKGIEAIFEYLRQLPEDKKVQKVNEAKLLLVGQGDVGKTCLAKRLKYNTFQEEKSTEGIDIFPWEIPAPTKEKEDIKLNMWDFGGQEIYHATHQFFLTKRSVYILVWNARKSQDYEHIYYWLHTIEAFGEDSPIILVMSKCHERDDELNLKDLKSRFPQIVSLYKIDCKDGTGIPILKDIISQVSWKLPHMQTPWVDSWFKVREQLEQDTRDWIEYKEFREICRSNGLDQKQTNILDDYLHDLGVIIHFSDKLELQDMVILKPEWATQAVYKIIDTSSVRERGGVLLHSELKNIWDTNKYSVDVFPQLLKLMERFELAYELPDKKSHLVAELLTKNEPVFDWDDSDNLRFYYFYDFLPAGVITRFIVRTHQDLESGSPGKHLCWREGVVLRRENTRAFVKMLPIEKRIEIKVKGPKPRELMAIIRYHLDHINRSIKKVEIRKKIPCNCSQGCFYLWDYDELSMGELKQVDEIQCMKTWKKTTISSLLEGYEKKEDRMKRRFEEEEYGGDTGLGGHLRPGRMIPVVNAEEKVITPVKKEKKPWYKTLWAVIGGLGIILALIYTAIQLIDRLFK
ncbi:MAG: leucine-rich repeat domain-containing protein [Candidatus Aminicenantes bacterium]|nr:MAG: leucine-rich repeat domain-containing protein [Candidatus Aminicenantes bacterium]